MGGQKFQYDESGGTFFYFLLSFLGLILIPATLYYWPRKKKEDPELENKLCHCPGCVKKRQLMKKSEPWRGPKNFIIKVLIILGWSILILLAYKVSQFDYEMANFDPYEILKVPVGSKTSEVKKAYRQLSLILHPDKETGNEKEFMRLTKAYQALTDDEARKNWEKYGNPDGPGAMSFGIALPSWIVKKENSVWVLGLYALVFMVALPIVVGTWWNRSIRFSGDQVLLNTTNLYYMFFNKTQNMPLKRIIMILSASLEFDRNHNSEIVERDSDNIEVPQLINKIENLNEKNKERPLCYPYSIKARAILHAHLNRIPLNENTLEQDRRYIVGKCPYLIQEQVNCVHHLAGLAYAGQIHKLPHIDTIENCMKLSSMIVQGLWEFKSPLLQLPHIEKEHLKYFSSKKRQIKTLQQYAQLSGVERRNVVRNFTEEQYEDIKKVLGNMPLIDFHVKCEVVDDENPTEVTAGAIVTVTVTLIRQNMSEVFGDETTKPIEENHVVENGEPPEGGDAEEQAAKRPAWLKPKKSAGKKKDKKTNKKSGGTKPKAEESPAPPVKNSKPKEEKPPKDDSDDSDFDEDDNDTLEKSSEEEEGGHKGSSVEDDDQEWEKFQKKIHKREKVLEGRSKTSHSVHCPLFPNDKQEYWWVYICDRKSKSLLTPPYHVTSLVDNEEFQLKFTAPRWKGVYVFTVHLRSDSYLGFDQQKDIKLDVKEAPAVITEHPQWEFGDSEEEGQSEDKDRPSDYTTDEDVVDEEY